MARIRATCEWCGDIDLVAYEVTIRVCSADMSCSAVFVCPHCGRGRGIPIHAALAPELLDAGSGFEVWDVLDELAEARSGAPICDEDLTAMHELLATPGWEQQILSPVPPPPVPRERWRRGRSG